MGREAALASLASPDEGGRFVVGSTGEGAPVLAQRSIAGDLAPGRKIDVGASIPT